MCMHGNCGELHVGHMPEVLSYFTCGPDRGKIDTFCSVSKLIKKTDLGQVCVYVCFACVPL